MFIKLKSTKFQYAWMPSQYGDCMGGVFGLLSFSFSSMISS